MNETTTRTIGLDISDRHIELCVIDANGDVIDRKRFAATTCALRRALGPMLRCRAVLEAGTHSPWISRELVKLGFETIVANPRQLRFIYESDSKNDRSDAEKLARVGRLDPALLGRVVHRDERSQSELAIVRSRDILVRARTELVSHVRGVVKSSGARLPSCSTRVFHQRAQEHLPDLLRTALEPVIQAIESLNERIKQLDAEVERCAARRPETQRLTQVPGVGTLTALTFVLTIDDPHRFESSRTVGAYLGLRAKQDQSGESDKQLSITGAGNPYLRQLLVECAHYIVGPFGPDSDLRRWGLKLMGRGGGHGRKRALVAVARKLAVLLHHLWVSEQAYVALAETRSTATA